MRLSTLVVTPIAALTMVTAALVMAIHVPRAAAQYEGRGTQAQRDACMADAFRFCLGSIPDHKRIEACLRSNRNDSSPACHREVFGYLPRAARSGR